MSQVDRPVIHGVNDISREGHRLLTSTREAHRERRLKDAIARVLDEATVQLLALTSSPDAAIRAAYEERQGIPAYDTAPRTEPRDELKHCRYCGQRFWSALGAANWCSPRCYAGESARRSRERRSEEVA